MHSVALVAAGVFEAHWAGVGGAPEHPATVAEALTWMIERCCHQIARDPAQTEPVANSLAEILWRVLHTA
jgi:hypothetical protein